MKELCLVLSGGGAKGFAHIGVLKVLEENNIKPKIIVGTSMGSIIGGFYAYGKTPEEMEEICKSITNKKIMDFNPLFLFQESILQGKKLRELVESYIDKETKIEDLKIKYVAVASSLDTGKQYNLEKGYLIDAIMASSAVPMIFPTVKIDGIEMVDGGLHNNLPEDVAKEIMNDNMVMLSVDVIGDYYKAPEMKKFKLANSCFNMMNLMLINQQKLKKKIANLRLEINQVTCEQFSFNTNDTLVSIELGESAMRDKLEKLKKLLKG